METKKDETDYSTRMFKSIDLDNRIEREIDTFDFIAF
jgi:hypothetical protein